MDGRSSQLGKYANELWLLCNKMAEEGFTLVVSGPFIDAADRKTGESTPVACGWELREWKEKFNGKSE